MRIPRKKSYPRSVGRVQTFAKICLKGGEEMNTSSVKIKLALLILFVFSPTVFASSSWPWDNLDKVRLYIKRGQPMAELLIRSTGNDKLVGELMAKAIYGTFQKASLRRMILSEASDSDTADALQEAAERIKTRLNKVLGSNPKIDDEVDAFVGMMSVFRSAKVKEFANEESLEKAWTGLMNAFKQGGDYRSLRNLMTALHNNHRNAKLVPGLVETLDDIGAVAVKGGKKLGNELSVFRADYSRWLRDLGDKPLDVGINGDYRWFGAIAEAKIGRSIIEVPGFEIGGWARYVNGRKAMDLDGVYGGKVVAIEVKNHDFQNFTNDHIEIVKWKVNNYIQQLDNHVKRLKTFEQVSAEKPGKHVVLAILGTDPTGGKIANLIEEWAQYLPDLKGFSKEQVVFLGIRKGEVGEAALKSVIGTRFEKITVKLKSGLDATKE